MIPNKYALIETRSANPFRVWHLAPFLLLALIFSSAGLADNLSSSVWRGSVGEQKVIVCFDDETNGSYYYERYLKPIILQKALKGSVWLEPNKTGLWTLAQATDTTLNGQWTKPGKKQSLPIHLTKVSQINVPDTNKEAAEYGEGCKSYAYHAALEIPLQPVAGKVKKFNDKEFRIKRIQLDAEGNFSSESIELLDPDVTIQKINNELLNKHTVKDLYACQRELPDGELHNSIEINYWTQRWLSITEISAGFCGGPYPFSGKEYRTWDLASGKEIDLWQWLAASNHGSASDALEKVILAHADSSDAELYSILKDNNSYLVRLSKKGMVFSTYFIHAEQAADQDIEVPYNKLLPFLTLSGAAEVKMIMDASQ